MSIEIRRPQQRPPHRDHRGNLRSMTFIDRNQIARDRRNPHSRSVVTRTHPDHPALTRSPPQQPPRGRRRALGEARPAPRTDSAHLATPGAQHLPTPGTLPARVSALLRDRRRPRRPHRTHRTRDARRPRRSRSRHQNHHRSRHQQDLPHTPPTIVRRCTIHVSIPKLRASKRRPRPSKFDDRSRRPRAPKAVAPANRSL